jgi:hypothetical protein
VSSTASHQTRYAIIGRVTTGGGLSIKEMMEIWKYGNMEIYSLRATRTRYTGPCRAGGPAVQRRAHVTCARGVPLVEPAVAQRLDRLQRAVEAAGAVL